MSTVVGEVLPDKQAYDVLRATFPAGTLSGAPKPRAMEIIESGFVRKMNEDGFHALMIACLGNGYNIYDNLVNPGYPLAPAQYLADDRMPVKRQQHLAR